MIDLNKLAHFAALAGSSSFADAARDLHISQPALTRSIQALESFFGVKLLERARGRAGISLTPAGIELQHYSADLLASAGSLQRTISAFSGNRQDSVAFGVGPMLANSIVADVVRGMIEDHPELETTVSVGDSASMMTRLLDGKLAFYVGVAPSVYPAARVTSEELGIFDASLYVRDGHPILDLDRPTVDDLLRYPIVAGTAWKENLLRLDDKLDRRLFEAAVLADNYPTLEQITRRSDCILVSAFQPLNPGFRRVDLKVDIARYNSKIMAFYRSGLTMSAIARECLERLRNSLHARPLMRGMHSAET